MSLRRVVVTVCDAAYFDKAKRTIIDVRSAGQYAGDIVLIAVDFVPPATFCEFYRVTVQSFPRFDISSYVASLREKPFSNPMNDRREFTKTTQWEKLHAFDPYFQQYDRMLFLDAGLRILDNLENFWCLDCTGKILAPDDTLNSTKTFGVTLETVNRNEELMAACERYNIKLNTNYFLNCIWLMDTHLGVGVEDLLGALDFRIWKHNEMGVMNAVLHFQRGLWIPFPPRASNGKFLFDWCELNRGTSAHWREYCALKYPVTIKFADCV